MNKELCKSCNTLRSFSTNGNGSSAFCQLESAITAAKKLPEQQQHQHLSVLSSSTHMETCPKFEEYFSETKNRQILSGSAIKNTKHLFDQAKEELKRVNRD